MKRELMTISKAAEYISMSKSWLYDHTSRKHPRVPVIRIGAALRFDPTDLDKFLDDMAALSKRRQ